MLQLFCMRLSSFEPLYPINVYGIFAIRDYLDPRRNYVFNRPRDDAVTIEKKVIKTSFPPEDSMLVFLSEMVD